MVIQHNISSLNAWRNTKINNGSAAKNLEKLSSGFKVNRSADDAAGLAISEKMRGQIRGLAMAEMNVKHGVNLIKTAEGGMEEIGNMLQRQRELIVQSLNGTYTDEDRELLQREIDQLTKSISGIASSTHFNGIQLLNCPELVPATGVAARAALTKLSTNPPPVNSDGSLSLMVSSAAGATSILNYAALSGAPDFSRPYQNAYLQLNDGTNTPATLRLGTDGHSTGYNNMTQVGGTNYINDAAGERWENTYTYNNGTYNVTVKQTVSLVNRSDTSTGDSYYDIKYDIVNNGSNNVTADFMFSLDTAFGNSPGQFDGPSFGLDGKASALKVGTVLQGSNLPDTVDLWHNNIDNLNARIIVDGDDISNSPDAIFIGNYGNTRTFLYDGGEPIGTDSEYSVVWSNRSIAAGSTLSVNTMYGATPPLVSSKLPIHNGANQNEFVLIDRYDCRPKALGISKIAGYPRDVANQSLLDLDKAINTIGTYRANCGAQQNRLEHSLNNLGVTKENLQAAESTIRDVDMAKEMMHFTKNNILVQASQSMLAQANQLPQGVLSMLK